MYTLFSIGHSNQSQEDFLRLLQANYIDCVVDVRSVPASKYIPQFNKEEIKEFLKMHNIIYLHFGNEFGARRTDCIDDDGQVNFELAVHTPAFLNGVERLNNGLEKGFRISLMCTESDPLECHRFSLVSRFFHNNGYDVRHILKDGTAVHHEELEKKMVEEYRHSRKYHLPDVDLLFGTYTEADQINDAYRFKNKEIGYKPLLENVLID